MPIKLAKKVKNKKIKLKPARQKEKFKGYLIKKIQKFYGTKSTAVIMIHKDFSLYKYLKRNRCDFKLCNHYIYKIPTNINESTKTIFKISDSNYLPNILNDLIFLRNNSNEFRNKYVYLVLIG